MTASTQARALVAALLTAIAAGSLAQGAENPLHDDTPADARADSRADPDAAARKVLALRDFERTYEMSNGRMLEVVAAGDSVRVRYGKRAIKVLRYDGLASFVSADGAVVLQFALDAQGQPELVTLRAPARWL